MQNVRRRSIRRRPRTKFVALTAALALVLAACGGDDDTAEVETPDPEPTEEPEAEEPEAEEPEAEEPEAEEPEAEETGDERSADDLPTFTFINQENLFGLNALVAEDQGFFEERGVNVEQIFNPSGAERATLVIGGTGDASILGVGSGMRGFAGDDWRYVGTLVQAGGSNALACDPELGIESVADLAGTGMGIAAADGSATWITFAEIIAPEFGLSSDDWELINLPTVDRLSAVAGGSAGCMLNQEPILTQASEEGLIEVVEDSVYFAPERGQNYDPFHLIIFVSTDFLEQDGGDEATTRFLAALQDARDYIADNQEEAAQIYIDQLSARGIDVGDDAETILIGVENQAYEVCIGEEFREHFLQWGEIQMGLGEIDEVPDPDTHIEWDINHAATGGCD